MIIRLLVSGQFRVELEKCCTLTETGKVLNICSSVSKTTNLFT